MNVENLTIKEKIGQMIIIGLDTNHITERIEKMITEYKVGGIILYRKNFSTYKEMVKLINELKQLNKNNKIPLFISIDQEGGRVNRMPPEIKNLPSANKIVSLKDKEIVIKSAKITGKLLKKSGFNLNFAPVLDIKRFSDRHAIGDRCYGKTEEEVAEYGIPVMKELQNQGIIPVIKHFPGHGATKQDSHALLPVINCDINKLQKEDMYPFEQAINQGADAILVGHLLIRKITGIYPASLSKNFITTYIRKKYKYRGLIITDDLKMKAIKLIYGSDLAVERAFKAGNDIIIFRFNSTEEKRILEKITKLVKKGKIKEHQINRSVRRIIKIKEKYDISDDLVKDDLDIDELNKDIEEIRNLVL